MGMCGIKQNMTPFIEPDQEPDDFKSPAEPENPQPSKEKSWLRRMLKAITNRNKEPHER